MQRRLYLPLLSTIVVAAIGCQPEPTITSYTVPKPESVETPPKRPPPSLTPMASAPSTNVQFDLPEGWREMPAKQFILKAFEVVDGDDRLEITISRAGGRLADNVNRWRGQIGLPSEPAETIEASLKPREVNGKPAHFVEMHQPEGAEKRESIIGIVVPDGDQTWFLKVRGSTPLVEREREQFEAFAKSVRW
jgi:hypothetical protein